MTKRFYTLDDFDFEGKTVLVRVDFNSPVDPNTGEVSDDSRIRVHIPTLRELSGKGARVVVLAHQGRRGDPEFVSLKQHARILAELLGRPVGFVDDVYGERARRAIRNLKNGDILVLENVRSAAHRADASLVAFAHVLPAAAGRIMEREVRTLDKVSKNPEKPCVYSLGGLKIEDTFAIIRHVLREGVANRVLISGLVANAYLLVKGYNLGSVNRSLIEKKECLSYFSATREVLNEFGEKIELPVDLAYDNGGKREEITLGELPVEKPIKDIGTKTIERYSQILRGAKTIVLNGPPGVFEEESFAVGTRKLFEAVAESEAFSLVGGGHTTAALRRFGLEKRVSYSTVAGGAFITYLSGEKLPAIEALEKPYEKGSKHVS
ncbi:MAG: phosphoglycerate kinase [Candidatus Freyarchaeota archaeon]